MQCPNSTIKDELVIQYIVLLNRTNYSSVSFYKSKIVKETFSRV